MKYLVIIALLIAAVAPAYAYIDAGSGSYVIQMAMAGILAMVFTIKMSWQRVKASAARLFSGNAPSATREQG